MEVETLSTRGMVALEEDDYASGFVMLSHQDESITVDASADAIENLHLSFNSGSSDMPVEEAEKYVKDLMKENTNLRESLEKHTAMLSRQYETFTTWQKQFSDTNAILQKALEDSRAQMLQKENDLKAALEAQHHEAMEKLKQEVATKEAQIGELTDKEKHLEGTVGELNNKVLSLEEALRDMEVKNKALAERYKETIERMDLLEVHSSQPSSAFLQAHEPISFLSASEIVSCTAKDESGLRLSEVVVQLHNEQSKTAQQSQTISSLTAEVTKLSEQLRESALKIASLKDQERQVSSSSAEVVNQAKRVPKLEESLIQKDIEIHNLQLQKGDTQRRLEEKTLEVETLRRAVCEAERRQLAAQQNYDELLKTWQEYERSGEHTFVRVERGKPVAQQQQLQDDIRELQVQASVMKNALEEKEQQLAEVRRMNEDLRRELELLPPLRAQLEVYSADYATEKEQRMSAQARIAELQEQLRDKRSGETGTVSQPLDRQSTQSASGIHSSPKPAATDDGLQCPLCATKCATRLAYIEHVQACVETTESGGP